jgi:hypothetical protein
LACEAKFIKKYVEKEPVDIDWSPSLATRFGNAFHKIMEQCKDSPMLYKQEMLTKACEEYDLNYIDHGAKIACMIRAWFANALDYECLACEVHIETEELQMYIDAVYKCGEKWFLVDRKTASSFDKNIHKKLATNQQIVIYVTHAHLVAERLSLKMEDFGGFKYIEVKKPMYKLKKDETFEQFTQRCVSDYRSTTLAPSDIKLDLIMENVKRIVTKLDTISPDTATMNFGSCMMYGSPCEYWSKCHGDLYSSLGDATSEELLF